MYYFNATALDFAMNLNSTQTWTVTILDQPTNLSIEFVPPTPDNDTYRPVGYIELNASVNTAGLSNVTFSLFNSSIELINWSTVASSPFAANFTGLADAVYYVLANGDWDGIGNETDDGQIRKITVDTVYPTVSFVSPTPENASNQSNGYIEVNATASDTNLANITVYLYNCTDGALLDQSAGSSSPHSATFGVLGTSDYCINATATDLAGNANSTETRLISMFIVNVSFVDPTPGNDSYVNESTIRVNLTSDDPGLTNLSVGVYDSMYGYLSGSSGAGSPYYAELTDLYEGVYYLLGTSEGRYGEVNTSFRMVAIDTEYPEILFMSPTPDNSSSHHSSSIFVNVSAYDLSFASMTIYLYNSSLGEINSSYDVSCNASVNFTGLDPGTYYIRAVAHDASMKSNETELRQVVLEESLPIDFGAGTPSNSSCMPRDSLFINISTITDSFSNLTIYVYNSSLSLVNYTFIAAAPYTANMTSLYDDEYYFNATVFATSGQSNSTETWIVTVDTEEPVMDIYPRVLPGSGQGTGQSILVDALVDDLTFANVTI